MLGLSYYLDRFIVQSSVASKFKIGQNAGSVTPPEGFLNYLGCTSLSAYTVGAAETFNVQQRIEGFNIADFGWGTASAKSVTLSFRAYSSLTGTFGGALKNNANDRSYPFTYSIPVANTWTTVSVTIAGETTGTWVTDSGVGIRLYFNLGTGSTYSGTAGAWAATDYVSATGATSVVGTSGATFYITGVQLETGTTATDFENLQYGQQLSLCQRYFEKSYNQSTVPGAATTNGAASSVSSTSAPTQGNGVSFTVTKRAAPTMVIYNAGTGAVGYSYRVSDAASVATSFSFIGEQKVTYINIPSSANGYYFHFTAASEL
jgi:hypothetical protein